MRHEDVLFVFLPFSNSHKHRCDAGHYWDLARFRLLLRCTGLVLFNDDDGRGPVQMDISPAKVPKFRWTTTRVPNEQENLAQSARLASRFQQGLEFFKRNRPSATPAFLQLHGRKWILFDKAHFYGPVEWAFDNADRVRLRPVAFPCGVGIDPFRVSYHDRRKSRAGDGIRTRDVQLGKFCRLSQRVVRKVFVDWMLRSLAVGLLGLICASLYASGRQCPAFLLHG